MKLKLRTDDSPLDDDDKFIWDDDDPPADNYAALAKRLAASNDIYRSPAYGNGLILLLPGGKTKPVTRGANLAPIIVDRVPVTVVRNGKSKGGMIPSAHLGAMLQAETFLKHFPPVDLVTTIAMYLPDFRLTSPGYNDGGEGHRILYLGDKPKVSYLLDTINAFLDVMEWESNADRTNAVGAALTVMLRNHWNGGKPIILATASKSHAGKDTTLAFAAGLAGSVSISYQGTNWALERSFVGAIKTAPDVGMVVVENARLDHRDKFIASAFVERFATDPEPLLFSTGTGQPIRRRNDLVLAISTNFGTASEDLLNRSLPICLHPKGDVANRESPIGNPKLEFLPAHREEIAAELRGMIDMWLEMGEPLDEEVRHPFGPWAKVVGGILKVNEFTDFLGNYGKRRTADDPLRHGLGLIGAAKPNDWMRPADWADVVGQLGLTKALTPDRDRENAASRTRAIGTVLSVHNQEVFTVEGDSRVLTLRLERSRHRQDGAEAKIYYRFVVVSEEALSVDEQQGTAVVAEPAPTEPFDDSSSQDGRKKGKQNHSPVVLPVAVSNGHDSPQDQDTEIPHDRDVLHELIRLGIPIEEV